MNDYFAYEIFDPTGGYCLFIHVNEDVLSEQCAGNIDHDYDHYHIGHIPECTSMQDAIQRIADGEWIYGEHNRP